jgi:hypothetical protein
MSPDSKVRVDRKFIAPFGRETLDLLLKKLFVTHNTAAQPLLTALAELASNQLANVVFEADMSSIGQKLDSVKRGLVDAFERKSEYRTVPGLQFRLGLLAPFQGGCSAGRPCDAALKTLYREDLALDLTLACSDGDTFCTGFGVQFPSIVDNITRAVQSGDRGPKIEVELFQRNSVQGNVFSATLGPVGRFLYLKESFQDAQTANARSWISLGAGFDLTFRFFGNILAGLRTRYYWDHRTFWHPEPAWTNIVEVGLYLGYGLNAMTWR